MKAASFQQMGNKVLEYHEWKMKIMFMTCYWNTSPSSAECHLFHLVTVMTSPHCFSNFSSLLGTPTCLSCFDPSVFPPPQPGKLAYSHNTGHREINYIQQETSGLLLVRKKTWVQRTGASATGKISIIKSSHSRPFKNMHLQWATNRYCMTGQLIFC